MSLLQANPTKAKAKKYTPTMANAAGYEGAQGNASNYNASQMDAASYDAASATAGKYNASTGKASTYKPTNYTADQREVGTKSTVAGQMDSLLQKDSDYMKRAETKGLQYANSRGILNTDMAVGAAYGSAMDAALPIAQQDASTYNNQSLVNQQYSNTANRDNAIFDNDANQFNATNKQNMTLANMNAENEAGRFNAGNEQQVNLANQNADNAAAQFNATQSQQAAKSNQDANNRANEFNATASQDMTLANMDSANQANQFTASNQQQTNLANQDAQNAAGQFNASAENRASEFNATQAFNQWSQEQQQKHQIVMENLSGDTKERLIQVEMDYKRLIDNEKSGSQAYMQAIDAMGQALGNSSLSAAQQQRAVDEITSQLAAFLDFNSVITGVEPSTPDISQQTSDYRKEQEQKLADQQAEIARLQQQLKNANSGSSSGGGSRQGGGSGSNRD